MSFGVNLAFMRKMQNSMTQEELAEKLGVSRQTVSKWEMDAAFPEMEKAIMLSRLFNCSLDELMTGDMNLCNDAYVNIRAEKLEEFNYVKYTVISNAPESDAIEHITTWAKSQNIEKPEIIGWDFPFVSQEQINVFHMHGYCAACILPQDFNSSDSVDTQPKAKYVVITIKEPFKNPFTTIPNAYKYLFRYMEVNGLKPIISREVIECFEKEYTLDGVVYMDVYAAIC